MAPISQCHKLGTWPTSTITEEMAPGPASMGMPKRHNPGVFLGCSLLGIAGCFLGRRTLGLQHVQPDQQQNQPARHLKRRKRDAEHPEQELACQAQTRSAQ